jgi:PAS domain S-box-containing protein
MCSAALFALWWNNRTRYPEIFFLTLGMSSCALGNIFQMLRTVMPITLSIMLGNPLMIGGLFMLAYGIRRHLGKNTRALSMVILLCVFSVTHAVLTFVFPNLILRITNFSIFIILASVFSISPFLFVPHRDLTQKAVALTFGLTATTSALRLFAVAFFPFSENTHFVLLNFDSIFLLIFMLIIVAITYNLTLMFHARLNCDLAAAEAKFSKIFHSTTFPILITRLENGMIYEVNHGFEQTFGYTAKEITGKMSTESGLWEDVRDRAMYIEQMLRMGVVRNKEFRLLTKSGLPLICLLSADNLMINGETRTLVTLVDITKIRKDEEEIRNLLKEKDYLMKEIYHRVKNNLNTVYSLLSLQASDDKNPVSCNAIKTAAGRVQSMAYLYDRLHTAENIKQASARDYLAPLMRDVLSLFPQNSTIKLETDIEEFNLSAKLLSNLGLIINELITNSIKHAFCDKASGSIRLSGYRNKERIIFVYSDDGSGFETSQKKSGGFGLELIGLLLDQIKGTMETESRTGKGTSFRISIPA